MEIAVPKSVDHTFVNYKKIFNAIEKLINIDAFPGPCKFPDLMYLAGGYLP